MNLRFHFDFLFILFGFTWLTNSMRMFQDCFYLHQASSRTLQQTPELEPMLLSFWCLQRALHGGVSRWCFPTCKNSNTPNQAHQAPLNRTCGRGECHGWAIAVKILEVNDLKNISLWLLTSFLNSIIRIKRMFD